jgi:cell division transport system permease protein
MLGFKKKYNMQMQALALALKNIRQQPFVSVFTTIMIGFILTWPIFLWVLSTQARQAVDEWHDKAFFTFYLSSEVSTQTREDIFQRLNSMQNLKAVRVITPSEALHRLLKQEDKKVLASLNAENPLPYVIEIQPNGSDFSAKSLAIFYKKISQIPYLQGSKNNLNWFERLAAFEKFLKQFTLLLVVILIIGVSFLVSNTLRMVIHSRYEEIQILKLVGATNKFILSPFLYTGAVYALVGALCAIFIVDTTFIFLQTYFSPLAELYQYSGQISFISFSQFLIISSFSVALGWGAAWVFVRYYLNLIEPV